MSSQTSEYCCDRRPANCLAEPGVQVHVGVPPAPNAKKTRVLFVDDEPAILRVLQMGMRSMTGVWDIEFAASGEEALVLIEKSPFDVVVSDMRMPGMNGAQFLNQVWRMHPQTVRIVLSGYADLSEVVKCVGLTHQFLEKPCSLDDLKNCVKRVTAVKSQLPNDQISKLTASLQNLPSLPELYLEIADALQSPTASAERIAGIASKDPAIAAKLLQLSNSAFFGFSHKIATVEEAVQLLGAGVIQSLAMAVPLFSSFSRAKCPSFSIDQLWEHSIQAAFLSQRIVRDQFQDFHLAEQAFCAGLLHDLGKIILADGLAVEYGVVLKEAMETRTPLVDMERKHFQVTHAEVGAYLLALWGLPIPLVEAVANHHHPHHCGVHELCLAGVVHLANTLLHDQDPPGDFAASPVDANYLQLTGLERQFEIWRQESRGTSH
jgi:HD-like signal output (HDOD) protein